ncbi:response regulator transcription factor [Streptomyces iconiensis]|uniref:Response regulator transcription factor n=1 Tax=Streptomyces iconiensis TaxID=1384038 RepID=A0ABT6ZN95_9ACTN|nr:response regulator transcription factor [Streptomyces iconiensis]MDJ1130533.1 response regulator transcription factor [Streptomyces iconiensis]
MTLGQESVAVAPPREAATAVSIAVVDENEFFRAGLVHFLSAEESFTVVTQSGTTAEAEAALPALRPDVVLVGVAHTDAGAPQDVARLRACTPDTRVVVLLARDDPFAVRGMLGAGVHAVLPRHVSPQELAGAVRVVACGSDRLVLSLSSRTLDGLQETTAPGLLTAREVEIVELVAGGLRNSQIARHLFITEGTVKRHLSNVYAKLGATCRTDAVCRAADRGLIPGATAEHAPPGLAPVQPTGGGSRSGHGVAGYVITSTASTPGSRDS